MLGTVITDHFDCAMASVGTHKASSDTKYADLCDYPSSVLVSSGVNWSNIRLKLIELFACGMHYIIFGFLVTMVTAAATWHT